MNKNNSDKKKLEKLFRAHGVAFAYLFGSQAQGKAHALSDRDIAVYFKPGRLNGKRLDLQLKLWNQLSIFWPHEKIDLIDLEEASLLLRFRVIQQGKLLFSCDEKQRISFEVSAMSHYFDRQYYIRRGADRAIHLAAQQGLR